MISRPSRPPLQVVGGKKGGNPGNNNNDKEEPRRIIDMRAYRAMLEVRGRDNMPVPTKDVPPKYKNADVKAELEAIIGKKMDKELEKMLDLPETLYRDQAPGGLGYTNDMHLQAIDSIGVLFPNRVAVDLRTRVSKGNFGILYSESTSDGYLILLNAKKGIAVRARIYSLFDEKANSWDDLKTNLKRAIEIAKQTSDENIIVVCEANMAGRFNIRENRFV